MRISIVTPYYNIPEHYFKPFLRSVLSQDWDDYELLIINDGSTRPECLKLLEEVDDEHVRILSKPNGGLSSARNFGLANFSGDLLYIADPDDELKPGLFSFIASAFDSDPSLDMLLFSTDCRSPEGKLRRKKHLESFTFTGDEAFASLCTQGSFMEGYTWNKVYNVNRIGRDHFGLFDTTITRHEDKLWALKLMKWVKKGRASDFVGYIYNLNPNGLTLDKSRRVRLQNSSYRAYDMILEYVESVAGRSSVYYEAMACYYCVCQWYLMQWIADRKTEDPDRAMRKDKLRTLHRELKGKGVTSREYSWRKWLTPLVLLLT